MTDERTESEMQPGRFDDDRLLACALGLDDDPELLAAAETDAALAARLAAMRGDVAAVGAQVAAAVPPPDASYADLAGERWSGLSEFFEPPVSAAKPRRAGRWWRVAAPVAALAVLALVVGIVAVDRGSLSDTSGSSESVAVEGAASSAGSDGASEKPQSIEPAAQGFAEQLDRFAIVVLARARAVSGALQRFAVVRIFKGEAPQVVQLEVDGDPADQGRLHLLLLDPVAGASDESAIPEPSQLSTTRGEESAPGKPLAVAYTYQGEPTVVRELAAGTDPDTVSLQIP
jgi:hypothetical protein